MPPALPLTQPNRRRSDPSGRLSEAVFGIDWSELVPCCLGSGAGTMRLADYAEVGAFLSANRKSLLDPEVTGSVFAPLGDGPAKARFCERVLDPFLIEADGEPVGAFLGQAWDWSTYYLRYLAVLPSHRGRGAVASVIERFADFLARYGFQRMEADVSISHRSQLRRVVACGFYPMGTLHSERWGALVHLVRFLDAKPETVFLGQFSAGPRSAMRPRGRIDRETPNPNRRD